MPLGTAFISTKSQRSILIQTLIEKKGLDYKIETVQTDEFIKTFPLSKRPAILTKDGEALTETLAIAYYLTGETDYFGKSHLEKATVLKWLSFANSDMRSTAFPLLHSGKNAEDLKVDIEKNVKHLNYLNDALSDKQFIVGNEETVADLFLFLTIDAFFQHLSAMVGKISAFPNIERWFNGIGDSMTA